ncbi:hypothetical protein HMPREF3222_01995 [Clostridium perfringens]|uniref:Uncharacterized protein n=1 Tax=Clostridium perfringens TaxID=1502 RepID=A0A133N3R3_CLOPF|nr:hypothetical protein HMPREF3222_01995 [Clostridium perfringens]
MFFPPSYPLFFLISITKILLVFLCRDYYYLNNLLYLSKNKTKNHLAIK